MNQQTKQYLSAAAMVASALIGAQLAISAPKPTTKASVTSATAVSPVVASNATAQAAPTSTAHKGQPSMEFVTASSNPIFVGDHLTVVSSTSSFTACGTLYKGYEVSKSSNDYVIGVSTGTSLGTTIYVSSSAMSGCAAYKAFYYQ